jgi:glycosyltransferase involved in cell wall biosynthesis
MIERVSVVIPAFNEEAGVGNVVVEIRELLRRRNIGVEIIVVDDGSSDHTAEAAKEAGARVIQHRSNRGYGASLKTGITAASHDVVAIIDADGTYPAMYLPELIAGMEHADMVVGARTGRRVKIPLVRRPAKWVLKHLANYVTKAQIPDLNSGLRVFRRDMAMQYFPILPDQFSFTTTITLAMLCDQYAVNYVSIEYRERKGRSKIVATDAGSFAVLIMRTAMLFRPLRVFLPLVFICLAYGLTKMGIDMTRDPNISATALMALLSALQLLLVGMLGDAVAIRLGRLNPHTAFAIQPREYVLESETTQPVLARRVGGRRGE